MDVKGEISPTMTIVGTVEPDSNNTEQAVESISFSYDERVVPDLRPFFLEGKSIYQRGGVAGPYFYSNWIGQFDTGPGRTESVSSVALTYRNGEGWPDGLYRGRVHPVLSSSQGRTR